MMNADLLKNSLSIWGAIIATILGIIRLIEFIRNRAKIVVNSSLVFGTIGENEDCKGTKVKLEKGGYNEILLEVKVANAGQRAIQITSIIIEEEKSGNINQVMTDKLPVLLDPLTSVTLEIQKEWLDNVEVSFFGVTDALGRKYGINSKTLYKLHKESNSLPSNKKKYVSKTDSKEIVEAFKVYDKSVIVTGKK